MKLLELLTLFHNWLTDKDFIWWPFSFLRPEPNVEMDFKLTSLMTLCFSGLTVTFFTIYAIMNNAFTPYSFLMTIFGSFLFFFLWFNLITKPLWNRRARNHGK